ncbi:MAG TPA: hypothetical protein VFA28_16420 [Bryobacteraceae bacterium]|jgi:uncharacterized protein (TIGR03437 family)|nr:hypothetical protein [Bryobacteraceae bacterium]
MKIILRFCLMPAFLAGAALAQPSIAAVQNNYSNIIRGMPNYGIAQGSVFTIFGSNLGPAQTPVLPDLSQGPLATNLKGVTVQVTVNGTTVQAIPYYVSATQIAAILPSRTPVGTGTVTVTFNNVASSQSQITVVPAAFGIDTLNGAGTGPAVAQNASDGYSLLSATSAANPGETLVLWGSGIGPAQGDETKYPFAQVDQTNASAVQVYIGGQLVKPSYAGRSQFPGVDQINVVVPPGVAGCNVSVVVQTGTGASTMVSNTATIPVAASGRVCSDPASGGLTSSDLRDLLAKGTYRGGAIILGKATSQTPAISIPGGPTIGGSVTAVDFASASFSEVIINQVNAAQALPQFQLISLGSCTVYQVQGSQTASLNVGIQSKALDAGTLSMKVPNGSTINLTKSQNLGYSLSGSNATGSTSPLFIPDSGGQFTFSNTGADVGPFSASITLPPAINWTNINSITDVNRGAGVTVTWDKTNPYSGFVTIMGNSYTASNPSDPRTAIASGFQCMAPYSAGAFTVPPYVLLAMTPSMTISGVSVPTGLLSLSLSAQPVRFTAPGLDNGFIAAANSSGKLVNYK